MARRFPIIFEAIAEGRLTVTAVCLISKPSKGLSRARALELIAATENKTKHAIRVMLAERFPQPDLASRVRALAPEPGRYASSPHVPERVEVQSLSGEAANTPPQALAGVSQQEVATKSSVLVLPEPPLARAIPLSPGRFGLQLTMSVETYEKWRRAEELLAPEGRAATMPSGSTWHSTH
jgi:hypothetical protein